MENPFTPKQDQCASGCAPDALINIEKCYEADPRLLAVSVPGVSSVMVFFKDTVRVIAKTEPCKDIYATTGVKAPAVYDHVVITGKMLYAEQIGLHFPPKPKMHTIELNPQATIVGTTKYPTAAELAEALQAIVADCGCSCADGCNIVLTGVQMSGMGAAIIISEASTPTSFKLAWNYNDGESTGVTECNEGNELMIFGDAMFLADEGTTIYEVMDCNDNCLAAFTNTAVNIIIPDRGEEDTVFTPDNLPPCEGTLSFTEIFAGGVVGVVLNEETGEVTIPAQSLSGDTYYGYSVTCNGVLVATIFIRIYNPSAGLRMLFDDIENIPAGVTDPSNVSQWNTFFNLPTNGVPFAGVFVSGNEVTLWGGKITEMATSLFLGAGILEFDAANNTTSKIGAQAFRETIIAEVDIPDANEIGAQAFRDCEDLTTVVAAAVVTVGTSAFIGCDALTSINLSACATMGTGPTDASVFNGIVGNTITISVKATLQTADAGNMHASLALLDANNTVTFNWI